MRTTVEIPDAIRARLLEIAAQRGEKGFSRIVEEALARYLDAEASRVATVEAAIASLGSLSEDDAAAMRDDIRALRATWR
jgi:predicted transcriptional regulator